MAQHGSRQQRANLNRAFVYIVVIAFRDVVRARRGRSPSTTTQTPRDHQPYAWYNSPAQPLSAALPSPCGVRVGRPRVRHLCTRRARETACGGVAAARRPRTVRRRSSAVISTPPTHTHSYMYVYVYVYNMYIMYPMRTQSGTSGRGQTLPVLQIKLAIHYRLPILRVFLVYNIIKYCKPFNEYLNVSLIT